MSNPLTRLFLDPVDAEADRVPARYRYADNRWGLIALAAGAVLLVVGGVVGLGFGVQRLLFAYLIGWVFCLSISLGALLFVMIQHVTKARWSTTIRRIPEALAASFPILALTGIPVLLGMHDLFHWSHAELYEVGGSYYDGILAGKSPYFFFPFEAGGFPFLFVARYVLYFVVWTIVGTKLYRLSVQNDGTPDPENTLALRRVSAWGIPLVGVTVAFAGYDYLMSLDPHWFSTMFGVYFFAGGWLGALCLITFIALLLKKGGMLESVTVEHIQDMGKFMFAFTVFWTYIAFSQYMLYWYANLPEEIVWFQKRFTEGWGVVAWSLLIFHFVLPFLILLPRITKRVYPAIATMAVWLLVMHAVDLWWIAAPAMYVADEDHSEEYSAMPAADETAVQLVALQDDGDGQASSGAAVEQGTREPGDVLPPAAVPQADETVAEAVNTPERAAADMTLHVEHAPFPIVELLVWLGLFGLYLGLTLVRLSRHALTPYGDPYFADSLRFENT